jgi:hypothetical protein
MSMSPTSLTMGYLRENGNVERLAIEFGRPQNTNAQ